MDCKFCHKSFTSVYNMTYHQRSAKSCIKIQENLGLTVDKKNGFKCKFCEKILSTNFNLTNHEKICKKKVEYEKEQLRNTQEELRNTQEQLRNELKQTKTSQRIIEEKVEDQEMRFTSEIKTNRDELEYELRIKDEKIAELEKRLELHATKIDKHDLRIVEQEQTPKVIHNHLNIFTSMSPERVIDMFEKHYTIETLMGGQKALADFIVDKFVMGKDGMVYLCVDRSRKKVCYTTDFKNFIEDTNNEVLLRQMVPAYPVIKSKVDFSEYEKKYNPYVNTIHESFDEILAIRTDGTTFRSQLCRRLPATVHDKERMDTNCQPFVELDTIRQQEEIQYEERKEEVGRAVERMKQPEKVEVTLVPNQIGGIGLGVLDNCRLLYKRTGEYKISQAVKEAVEADPAVAQAYEDYVKRGTFKGKVIWE